MLLFYLYLTVLHHPVEETIRESHNMGKNHCYSCKIIWTTQALDHPRGAWDTPIIPNATRTLAFFLLNTASKLNIAVPGFLNNTRSQSLKGLKACFYSQAELKDLLENSGLEIVEFTIYLHTRLSAIMRQWKKLAFLKNWGQMRFIVRKANKRE
jgi:hypothetical protein